MFQQFPTVALLIVISVFFCVHTGCEQSPAGAEKAAPSQKKESDVVSKTEPVGNPEATANASKAASNEPEQRISADQALMKLKEGNERFSGGHLEHPHETRKWRAQIASGQHPFATVLGCSDSRVTPELIFDEGLGDLFVIRVAGNIVDDDVTGSIEYAVEFLDTHLVIVLGHENCGAVTAAMGEISRKPNAHVVDEPQELSSLVYRIRKSITAHHDGEPDVGADTEITQAVRKNVLCSVRQLQQCPDLSVCLEHHNVKVVGAIYNMETGEVEWLD